MVLTTIVLVHGLSGDRHVWDDVVKRLGSSRQVSEGSRATLRGWFGSILRPSQLERALAGLRKLSNETILGYVEAMATQPIHDGG
jgi:hypothetical protein